MDTEQQGRAVWREEKEGNGRRRGICDIYGLQGGTRHGVVGGSSYNRSHHLSHPVRVHNNCLVCNLRETRRKTREGERRLAKHCFCSL